MDKKALQEQFEDIATQNCWNINKYPAGWDGRGDDEYADDFVNGAWWAFQEQQAKVEELERIIKLRDQQLTEEIGLSTKYVAKCDELKLASQVLIHNLQIFMKSERDLQKRVDAVKGLAQTLWEKSNEKHEQGKVWESKTLGECADEILDVLEQALKGEGSGS